MEVNYKVMEIIMNNLQCQIIKMMVNIIFQLVKLNISRFQIDIIYLFSILCHNYQDKFF